MARIHDALGADDICVDPRSAGKPHPTSSGNGSDPGDSRYDYTDSFELTLGTPDDRSAEEWARAALEDAPAILRGIIGFAHRSVLRFDLAPPTSPNHVLGWTIAAVTPREIRLEAAGPLMHAVIVGSRPTPSAAGIRTFLTYRYPRAGA